jgi:hypothetical protein
LQYNIYLEDLCRTLLRENSHEGEKFLTTRRHPSSFLDAVDVPWLVGSEIELGVYSVSSVLVSVIGCWTARRAGTTGSLTAGLSIPKDCRQILVNADRSARKMHPVAIDTCWMCVSNRWTCRRCPEGQSACLWRRAGRYRVRRHISWTSGSSRVQNHRVIHVSR